MSRKQPLPRLREIMHLISDALLDYANDLHDVPSEGDIAAIEALCRTAEDLRLAGHVARAVLIRRRQGLPEIGEFTVTGGMIKLH